jgi:branched-chain amino acid transport system ATP-binding protein
MSMLAVRDLAKSYGGVDAVRGVSFDVAAGELVALIGPNGAGKTTTFNMLNGQIKPDGGTVSLDGRDVTGLEPRALWRMGVGRTFQIAATFLSMTVAENVEVALMSQGGAFGLLRRGRDAARRGALDLLRLIGMTDQAARVCGELAYGDVKRVELAIALANSPRLLLMDEPCAGMAPKEREQLMKLAARTARERNTAVLFTEHDMDVVFGHATRVLVMNRGRLIASGTPGEVRANDEVRAIYLGSRNISGAAAS